MHPQIEKYLERVKGQLKSLPPEQCAEEIREMGIHLQALVEEGRERGLGENEAAKAAIAQFGSPRAVGQELCQVVHVSAPDQLPKTLSVLAFFMLASTAWHLVRFSFTVLQLSSEGHLDEYFAAGFGNVCFGLILGATNIYTAISLRQLKPWAFWMGLLLAVYNLLRVPLSLMTIIYVMNRLPPEVMHRLPPNAGNGLAAYFLSQAMSLLFSTCCILALVLNRESFFRAAKLRWSK